MELQGPKEPSASLSHGTVRPTNADAYKLRPLRLPTP